MTPVPLAGTGELKRLLEHLIVEAGFHLQVRMTTHSGEIPEVRVVFEGEDVPLLLRRNAELLFALEHVAAKALGLDHEDHERISFDAAGFKHERDMALRRAAQEAARQVLESGQPYAFAPMTSRERRLLHLILGGRGLATSSVGEGPRRHLVVSLENMKTES